MFAPGVLIGQQVVALHFGFGLLLLLYAGLAVAQGGDVAFYAGVVHLDNRCVLAGAGRSIIHRVHHLELEVFQEVPFAVHISRTAVNLGLCGVRFQFHVHHWVVHLRLLEVGQRGVQPILFVEYRYYRRGSQCRCHALRIGRQHPCTVELETYLEVIRYPVVVADVQRNLAVLLLLDVSLLVGIARTEVEAVLGRSSGDADVIVGDEPRLEDFVLPVGVPRPGCEVVLRVAFVPQLLVVQQFEAFGIGHRYLVRHPLEAERTVDVHPCLSLFGALGGDDNHSVRSAHTEDGERGRVFQNLHGLDVLRVEEVDVVVEQSVYHIQGLVTVDGVGTAYTYLRVCSRFTGVDDLYACHLSLQCRYRVCHRLVGNLGSFDVGDGAGQVAFLRATVADDDGLCQHLCVVFHLHIDYRLIVDLDQLLHHADV